MQRFCDRRKSNKKENRMIRKRDFKTDH